MAIGKTAEERREGYMKRVEQLLHEHKLNTPKPDLLQHIWTEENLEKYRISLRDNAQLQDASSRHASRKLFFISPKGTLLQNDLLVELVVNYINQNVKESTLLELLLSHGTPVFRANCMSETAPRSGEFVPRSFDLIEQIVKRKDALLLKKLYQYIDLSEYEDYAKEIDALMND